MIHEVEIFLDLLANSSTLASFAVAAGLYKGKRDRLTGQYSSQNPSNSDDAGQDSWLTMWARHYLAPAETALNMTGILHVPLTIHYRKPIVIGQGENLQFTVGNSANSGTGVGYGISARVKITRET